VSNLNKKVIFQLSSGEHNIPDIRLQFNPYCKKWRFFITFLAFWLKKRLLNAFLDFEQDAQKGDF